MYVKEIEGRNFNAEKWLRAQRYFSWKLSGLSETNRVLHRLEWGKMESAALHTPRTSSVVPLPEVPHLPEFSVVVSMVTTGRRTHTYCRQKN